MQLVIFYYFLVATTAVLATSPPQTENLAREFSRTDIYGNLETWGKDMAILFYAPWSTKALDDAWDDIAHLTSHYSNLAVGKYNCEHDIDSETLCASLNVNRYPLIVYIGYGNYYHESSSGNKRAIHFASHLIPMAVYDWVLTMSFISTAQRYWGNIFGIFSQNKPNDRKNMDLQSKVAKLERKVELFSHELEKYKANEVFDTFVFTKDPFIEMAAQEPDTVKLL
jgi:hypothetical protein